MPIDGVGEVVVAALEAVGDVALTEPPRRGRWRRIVYWLFMLLVVGLLIFGAYVAFG